MSGTDVIERGLIAEAYLEAAGGEGGKYVSIAEVKERLAGRVRDLDAKLVRMYHAQQINLVPRSNRRALTPADRAAAIRCGGEDKHRMYWAD